MPLKIEIINMISPTILYYSKWNYKLYMAIAICLGITYYNRNSKEEDFKCFRGKLMQKLEEKTLKKSWKN